LEFTYFANEAFLFVRFAYHSVVDLCRELAVKVSLLFECEKHPVFFAEPGSHAVFDAFQVMHRDLEAVWGFKRLS
jgi:hypothetical protein